MEDNSTVSRVAYSLGRTFRRALPVLLLLIAATLTMLVGYLLGRSRTVAPTPHRIEVRVLNVQHGEATLIRTGRGRFILLGAGPTNQVETVIAALKEAKAERLALLILPYPGAEAMGGAEAVLEAFPTDEVLTPGLPPSAPWQERLEHKLASLSVPVKAGRAGEVMVVDDVRLEIVAPAEPLLTAPPPAANNSLVLRMVWGETRFLFAGGIGAKGETALLSRQPDLSAQWLRIARSGIKEATTPEFLRLVSPEHIVVSVGPNRDGLPHPETMERIEATGAKVYRTDTADGPLVFASDGVQITGPK
jgi:competence protein ComEC